MSSSKEQEAQAERDAAPQHDAPPVYHDDRSVRPTVESPFNFPSDGPLPSYSEAAASSSSRPIVIPQIKPEATAPLLKAYAPTLLQYGIPKDTWLSLLDTVSAFLAAKVADRAIRHASNMGSQVGEVPKDVFKGVYSHVKGTGKNIGNNAKRGNIIGAAAGVIGGAISIPVHAALGTVRAAVGVPISAVHAATKKPETPRERADAYFGVVNRDWLNKRGLHATLLDSQELSQLVGVSVVDKIELREDKDDSVEAKVRALGEYAALLEVEGDATLAVGPRTLWVVLTQVAPVQS